jgi:hypothetical protein
MPGLAIRAANAAIYLRRPRPGKPDGAAWNITMFRSAAERRECGASGLFQGTSAAIRNPAGSALRKNDRSAAAWNIAVFQGSSVGRMLIGSPARHTTEVDRLHWVQPTVIRAIGTLDSPDVC